MILPAKLVNERLMFLIDYGDKLPWGSVVTGAKIEVTVSSGEDTTPQKVFSQVWGIDGTIVTYQVRNGLPGVVYDLNTAVQVSGEWLYMTVKLAVLPDSGDVGALYPLTRVFTSLPYVQLMTDEISQGMEPTSGVLVQILYESELQPDNVDLTMEPTGGDLLIPPPGETFSESEMGLIPTDGDLFTPPTANIDPNSAVVDLALEPSTGILAVPPLGNIQVELVNVGLSPTGGTMEGTGAWTPAALSPVEWWDFSDAATVTSSGGFISAISSKGSGARSASQGTGGFKPSVTTINGVDAAQFDGSGDHLSISSSLSTTTGMTVAQVFTRPTAGVLSQTLGGSGASVPPYAALWFNDNVRYSALWGSSSSYATHGGASTSTGAFQHIVVKGASTTLLYQDGAVVGTPQTTLSGVGSIAYIGRRATNYHNGKIGEIVVVASDISTADREKLEGYLAHKWGIAGALPSGHPYKSAPPG